MKVCFAFGHLNRPESITRTCYSIGARETFNHEHFAKVLDKREELLRETDTSASAPTPDCPSTGVGADIYLNKETK